jgi:hypothetical protein
MSRHHDEDIRDLLQRLTDQNADILARISALERQRDRFSGVDEDYMEEDEFDHAADKFARSDPSGTHHVGEPSRTYDYGPSGPMIGSSQSLPRVDDHPAYKRYRKDTDNICDTFGSDVARFAASQKIHEGTPVDTALAAVSRYRRSRSGA